MRARAREFRQREDGTVALLAGLLFVAMFGLAGTAIDFGRAYAARSADEKALDAAVMAGARVLQNGGSAANAKATAAAFFEANLQSAGGGTATFDTPDAKTFNGFVTGEVPTTLMRVLGVDSSKYRVASGARLQAGAGASGNLEIAVMLDVTGSMCSDGAGPCTGGMAGASMSPDPKMRALKDAAKELVDIVVWDDQSEHFSKIAIVPFSTRIRVAEDGKGADIMGKLTDLGPVWNGWYNVCVDSSGGGGSEDDGNWTCHQREAQQVNAWKIMPCVTDRTGDEEFTDAAPGPSAWLNAHGGDRAPYFWDSSDNAMTSGTGNSQADPAWHWNYNDLGNGNAGVCEDVANANEVQPLTSDKDALNTRIEALEAFGSTNGGFATAFAWYMLSPNWSSIWTGQSTARPYSETQPDADGKVQTRKVAILMSDGVYNTHRGWKDQDKTEMSTRAKQLCEAMKDKGIEIYTVGFALNELDPADRDIAIDTLQSCGSDIDHFYNTLDIDEMKQAFRDIAYTTTALSLFTPEWPE